MTITYKDAAVRLQQVEGGIFFVRTVFFVSLAWCTPKGATFHCNFFLLSVWNATLMLLQIVNWAIFNVRKMDVIGHIHAPAALPTKIPGTH
jgi:hypothetical protein